MKKKYLTFSTLLLTLPILCIGQQNKIIDSLLDVLKIQKDDTSKVSNLNTLSNLFVEAKDFPQAQKKSEDALLLAEKLNFKKGIAASYYRIAIVYAGIGNYAERLKNNLSALKIYKEIGDNEGIYDSYMALGAVYSLQGNHPEALKNSLAALKIAEEMGDKQKCLRANNLVGAIFSMQLRFSETIKYFFASLKIAKELGNKFSAAINCLNIGDTYILMSNYREALKNYLEGFKIADELGHKGIMSAAYQKIAELYSAQLNFPEALKYHHLAHKIRVESGRKDLVLASYSSIGNAYNKQAMEVQSPDSSLSREQLFSEALKNYWAALKIAEEIGSKKEISYSYQLIGDCYANQLNFTEAVKNYLASLKIRKEAGENLRIFDSQLRIGHSYTELKQFPEAKQFLNDALFYAKKTDYKIGIKESYDYLAHLDEVMDNWKGANENYKLFIVYRDSVDNKENTAKILRLQLQYEFDKKEDSLKFQQALTDEELKQQTLVSQQQSQALLLKEKEIVLFSNEKQLQRLKIEKDEAAYAVQKIEGNYKQSQLVLLNKERAIQTLDLKKQKQLKNYLIAGLFLFAILSFFIYRNYRTRQQLKMQMLRNKIASDLHDDVGSTLSSISIFSQMAQQQSKEVIPLLETIEESSRKMLDAMADIVWTINPENDQFEKIVLRMRSFAYELLGAKKIDFEFNAEEDVTKMKLSMDVRKNLYLIFKEATNNMVKYSGADKAMFTIKGDKNNLTLFIRDNGKGFDTQMSSSGNGLKNMRKRAEEISAQFTIVSKTGCGTTIELRVAV